MFIDKLFRRQLLRVFVRSGQICTRPYLSLFCGSLSLSLYVSLDTTLSTKTSTELAQSVAYNCQRYTRFWSVLSRTHTHGRAYSREQARNSACEVLIRDLHEKIELLPSPRPPSIPASQERERREGNRSLRSTREYDATRCHFAEQITREREGRRDVPEEEGRKTTTKLWVLKPKRASRISERAAKKKSRENARKSDRDKSRMLSRLPAAGYRRRVTDGL